MSLRALDTDEPLRRYLELKIEIDRLSEEMEALKGEITAALWEEPENRCLFMDYEIMLGIRRTYAYSDAVQKMEQDLKSLKAYERSRGLAEVTRHTSFPIVTPVRA